VIDRVAAGADGANAVAAGASIQMFTSSTANIACKYCPACISNIAVLLTTMSWLLVCKVVFMVVPLASTPLIRGHIQIVLVLLELDFNSAENDSINLPVLRENNLCVVSWVKRYAITKGQTIPPYWVCCVNNRGSLRRGANKLCIAISQNNLTKLTIL
jgi:hypothetical protein